MTFKVEQKRTYTTWIHIDADSSQEAVKYYLEMVESGVAYDYELEQMNVEEVYKVHEVDINK